MSELYHYGVKNQKWGTRRYQYEDGTWTEEGKRRRRRGREQRAIVDNLINDLNTNFDYGVIIDGIRYDDDMSKVDWDKYRTMPVKEFEKEKIGVCWDFVNYQSYICNKNGIPNKNYMAVCQRSDDPNDILTHTFTIVEINGKLYWIESAWHKNKGVHEISSPKDVFDIIKNNEDSYSDHPLDCDFYEYDPTGMDNNLTNGEYFDKATQNLVYTTAIKHSALYHYEVGTGYGPRQTSYASKYYDPVKAHEYYERTKQLKGRTRSTSSLNDEGKEKWAYVKERIQSEKQAAVNSEKAKLTIQIQSIQSEIAALKSAASGEKQSKKWEIKNRIQSLRTQLQQKKAKLQAQLKTKQESAAEEKKAESKKIQNENKSIQETATTENKRKAETIRAQNEQVSKSVQATKEQMSSEIAKKREQLNSTTDKAEKAKLRTEISKMSAEKQQFSSAASAKMKEFKANNSAELANFRAANSAQTASKKAANLEDLANFKDKKTLEVSQFRAKTSADVKSATERTNSAISSLREELSTYNEQKRQMTNEEAASMRASIKLLREANQQNRKKLTEKYTEIQNDEFDKIAEFYPKKGKK